MNEKEHLIQKLFDNQCSEKELHLLFELVEADESETAPEVMLTLMHQMGKVPDVESATSEKILRHVLKNTVEIESTSKIQNLPSQARNRIFRVGRVAAVGLFLVIAGWFSLEQFNPSELIVQTGFDERKEMILPDGSKVILNGNSSLKYFAVWSGEETRVVKLEGEAYFEVAKKPSTNAKFQVLTNDLTIEVLGTVFNVNTRKEKTKVFLEEGKVKLNLQDKKSSELILEPGEVVSYSAKRKLLMSPQKTVNEIEVSWKDGFLTFKDTPLKEILEKLSETTNLEFEIETTFLASRKWTLALPNDKVEEAISVLSTTTGTQINKVGNKYTFQEKEE